jgi:BA14K-like protein
MKSVFVLFATLGLSLMTFISGLAAATFLLHAGETPSRLGGSNVASLWTNEPVRIDPAHNMFERLPAIEMASGVPASGPDGQAIAALSSTRGGADIDDAMVDDVALAATEEDAQSAPAINEAHLEWCANRYRSYRPRDNSYTAYSGGRRECASPFPTHAAATIATNDTISPMPDRHDSFAEDNFPVSGTQAALEPHVEQASLEGATGFVTAHPGQSCSVRYRSYSADDNSYQPYGGGPRVKCE